MAFDGVCRSAQSGGYCAAKLPPLITYQSLCTEGAQNFTKSRDARDFKTNQPFYAVTSGAEAAGHDRFVQPQIDRYRAGGAREFANLEVKYNEVL